MVTDEPVEPRGFDHLRSLAGTHATRLESMFGGQGLASLRKASPTHPAVHQIDVLRDFSRGGLLPIFDEIPYLTELSAMLAEAHYWPAPRAPADPWSFEFGPEVKPKYFGAFRNTGAYSDLVCELYTWGRLQASGFVVTPLLSPGLPDFLVECAASTLAIEVKHVRRDAAVTAIQRHLAKANQQLKEVGGTPGVVYLYLQRGRHRVALDDRVPHDIRAKVSEVSGLLHGAHYRSISLVLIVWDDVLVMDFGTDIATYFMRRRVETVVHPAPWNSIGPAIAAALTPTFWSATSSSRPALADPLDHQLLATGAFTPPRLVADGIEASTAMRTLNELGDGIRAEQAIEVLGDPDRIERTGRVVFATRRIEAIRCVLLVIGVQTETNIQIAAAFRLPDDPLMRDPRELLEELLATCGVSIREASAGDSYVFTALQGAVDEDGTAPATQFAVNVPKYLSAARALEPPRIGARPRDGRDHLESRH